jgi:hypothetical protein
MSIEPSEFIRLPIGIEKDGTRYRDIVVDELNGVDEELLSNKKKTGGNQAKGLTMILARSIQEISGLVERKSNPDTPIDHQIPRMMYQVDRDYVFSRIQILSERDETVLTATCPKCGELYEENILMSERPVKEWPEDTPLELKFELPRGYTEINRKTKEQITHKTGVIRFPLGRDQEAVGTIIKHNQGKAMTAILAACIKSLGTLDSIDQQITARLKGRDRKHLFKLIRDQAPGMKIWETVTCYECGYEGLEAVVDFSGFFG